MNREELLVLCDRYVRRRGLGQDAVGVAPALQIIESFLHAEISESEKNSLLAYVWSGDGDDEDVGEMEGLGVAALDDSHDRAD